MADVPHILVVDPDDDHRRLLLRTLSHMAPVEGAATGDEARALLREARPEVVIADQSVPGASGIELLELAAALDPHVGRILVTSFGDTAVTIEAIDARLVDAHLSKPCLPHQLRLSVASLVDRCRLARENARLLTDLRGKNAELERTMERLRQTQRRVIEAERLDAIARMSAMLAHDFRGPLSVIQSGATHLSRGDLDVAEGGELGQQLGEEAARMQRLCDELVATTRASAQPLELRRIDVDDVVHGAAAVLADEAGRRGVELRTRLEARSVLWLDADRLRRAILNLGYNALEALPEGGHVWIRSGRGADHVRIVVADDGVGIPEEFREHLFEPFASAGKCGGTGLGLAVVKKVVEDHGGSVRLAKTAAGVSTAFQIDLPEDPEPGEPLPAADGLSGD
ncbi:MAG: hypothetical protein CL910_03895 [Deltaproteobacteria bacterium]|jgi:signal transduction histidine kinase|nr:hypothetical protein [Deltaproteobacteria bacterium]